MSSHNSHLSARGRGGGRRFQTGGHAHNLGNTQRHRHNVDIQGTQYNTTNMINDAGGFYDGYDTGFGYTGVTTDVSTRHYHNENVSPMGRKRGGGGPAINSGGNSGWQQYSGASPSLQQKINAEARRQGHGDGPIPHGIWCGICRIFAGCSSCHDSDGPCCGPGEITH